MTDGVQITPGSGTTILTDDTGAGGHAQVVKLGISTDGSATLIPADAGYGMDVDLQRLPASLLDSFGKIQVVNAFNDIDTQFWRDDPNNACIVTASNGGAAAKLTGGAAQMTTSATGTGEVKMVSRDSVLYRSGGEIFALFTTAWVTGGTANCNQRIGLYDSLDGIYIGYEGTSFGMVVRNAGVDGSQITKANFNVDTLTGAAGSKFTRAGTPEAINLALLNVWRLRFGWLGAAPIKLEVLSPDGEWVLCHVIRQPNFSATPHISRTDLPITAHLVKTSGATNVTFNTACWGAGLTYDKVDIVGSNTLTTTSGSTVVYNVQGVGTLQLYTVTGTTGAMILEGTVDGSNWITHPAVYLLASAGGSDTQVTAAVTPTTGATYRLSCAGFRAVRVRVTSTLGASVVLHAQGDSKTSMLNVSNDVRVVGNVAHDGADTMPPVKVGHKAIAHGSNPAAVAAADRTDWYANRHGIPFVMGGHPNIVTVKHTTVTTAVTNDAVITVSAGTKIVVTSFMVTLDSASTVFPTFLLGFGAASTPTTTGVIGSHGGIPAGGGFGRGDGSGIIGIGADGEDLRLTTTGNATGNGLQLVVTYYTIES